MTLTEFLLARIAEDEAVAKAAREHEYPSLARDASRLRWTKDHLGYGSIFVNSGRVLAECEAKRRIVALWAEEWPEWHGSSSGLIRTTMTADQFSRVLDAERVLGLLALPYADHEDYRAEWRP